LLEWLRVQEGLIGVRLKKVKTSMIWKFDWTLEVMCPLIFGLRNFGLNQNTNGVFLYPIPIIVNLSIFHTLKDKIENVSKFIFLKYMDIKNLMQWLQKLGNQNLTKNNLNPALV
jgi:hypothetical protein